MVTLSKRTHNILKLISYTKTYFEESLVAETNHPVSSKVTTTFLSWTFLGAEVTGLITWLIDLRTCTEI